MEDLSKSASRLEEFFKRMKYNLRNFFDVPFDNEQRREEIRENGRQLNVKCVEEESIGYLADLPFNRYKTTDRYTLNYLKSHDPWLPHSVNTVHLQNPYKTPRRLEGYTSSDSNLNVPSTLFPKEMQLPARMDSNLRSRYKINSTKIREAFVEDEKFAEKKKRDEIRKDNLLTFPKKAQAAIIVEQYCSNSTLHGLRYVGDTNLSVWERIFWIISFIAAAVTASLLIWSLYTKWNNTPIIISMSPESVSFLDFPFPSVTVCNMNNAIRSEADRINYGEDNLEKLFLDDICNFPNKTMLETDLDDESVNWERVKNFMLNVSQPCPDMLHLCQWHGTNINCSEIFNPIMTDEGLCCNFNSVTRENMFYNPHEWSDFPEPFPSPNIDWSPETGYNESILPDVIPRRPYGAGISYGLSLVLDADTAQYFCSSTASVGFKMLLHNPVETPKIADFAFALKPGEETRVIITPRISGANPSVLSVAKKKRKCFFTKERRLKYYRTYTQRNCILECEANFTQKLCNCVQYYMPKSANTRICGKKDDHCASQAKKLMETKLYDEESTINEMNISQTPSCNCWPGCFEINYNIEVSQSGLATAFYIDDDYVKNDKKYFVHNMAVVHLYFVESQFTKNVKNELFGLTEFISNTGGVLGLFMGFSVLSLMEILYFATLRLWCHLYHNKNSMNHLTLPIHSKGRTTVYPFAQ